jgi:hypothetical protein
MSDMAKWVPLVRKLARKHKAVNLVYTSEDLEQEAWINIIKYWPKIAMLTDVEIEKNIKTIFKRKVIDIIRSQMRRPDTHWSYKSNVVDPLGQTTASNHVARTRSESPDEPTPAKKPAKEIKLNPIRIEAGRFLGEVYGPEDTLAGEAMRAKVLGYVADQEREAREELAEAVAHRDRSPGRESEKDVKDSEANLQAAVFSRRIVEALLNDEVPGEKSNGREVCKALDIPAEHWTRTVRELQVALEVA